MICRFFEDGQKLNVSDLNEITVLVDRSETGRVAIGSENGDAGRGHAAFVPRNATFAAEATGERLTFLHLETIIDRP
jgi:hypothetical protein